MLPVVLVWLSILVSCFEGKTQLQVFETKNSGKCLEPRGENEVSERLGIAVI
jgi:hypothetical protein